MKKTLLLGANLALLMIAVGLGYALLRLNNPEQVTQSEVGAQPIEQEEEVVESQCEYNFSWEDTFAQNALETHIQNVTDILTMHTGEVLVSLVDDEANSYIMSSVDKGRTWDIQEMPEVKNVRALRELSDGRVLLGGSARAQGALVYERAPNGVWEPLAEGVLPSDDVAAIWDIQELSDGSVLLMGDGQDNDAQKNHQTVYRLTGRTVEALDTSFPGLGVLAVAVNDKGTIVLATQESDEHDDPEQAGQALIFISDDNGYSWVSGGVPEGVNRIYDLHFHTNGTLFAGTGIRGEFLRSVDNGLSWETMTHVPDAIKPFGENKVETTFELTRIYQILELCDGSMLVGTGNQAGQLFQTFDEGETWLEVEDPGSNIVVWGLAQETDGTLWVGTGSRGGMVLKSK
ncbi:MAG: hypothetical protein P8J32_05025 [bacterium]|nr:hypothetical protein [bacterium]